MSRTDLSVQPSKEFFHTHRAQLIPIKTFSGIPKPSDVTTMVSDGSLVIGQTIRAGNVNPNYRKLLETASLPPNKFSYYERVYNPATGVRRQTTRTDTGLIIQDNVTTDSGTIRTSKNVSSLLSRPSAAIVLNLTNQSLAKARLKLKDQDVNLAEVWGERHESINMIRKNVDRIGKTLSSLKKGDFRGAAAALGVDARNSAFSSAWGKNQSKALANGWLELVYGWRPLIMDIHGAAEALHKSFEPPKKNLIRVSAVSKLSDSKTVQTPGDPGISIIEDRYEVEVKTCLYFRQRSSTLHTLAALGITNPLYVAWELTKYSFVLDWLVHVGDFLSSLDATIGYDYLWGCVTVGTRNRETKTILANGVSASGIRVFENSEEFEEEFSVQRSGLGLEIETIPLPALKDPRTLEHTLNSIALLRQTFKR